MVNPFEFQARVLAKLGDNDIDVELGSEDWATIFSNTIDMYNRYRPKIVKGALAYVAGTTFYNLDPTAVGRGIAQVHFPTDDNSFSRPGSVAGTYLGFNSNYYALPLFDDGYSSRQTQYKVDVNRNERTMRQLEGSQVDWDYNIDTKQLAIYNGPTNKALTLTIDYMHNRYFDIFSLGVGNGATTSFSTELRRGFDPLNNVLPYSMYILQVSGTTSSPSSLVRTKIGEYLGRINDQNKVLSLTGSEIGTYTPSTGNITINLATAPSTGSQIYVVVNETREEDITWIHKFLYSQACIVIGNKRSYFSGTLSGSQQDIQLDVEKLQQGIESEAELIEEAKLWALDWYVPRLL